MKEIEASGSNDLYGFFGIQGTTGDQKTVCVGLVCITDASGDYYSKESSLGFSTGQFSNINTFLMSLYLGQGLAQPIMDKVWEKCEPFVGKLHKNCGLPNTTR